MNVQKPTYICISMATILNLETATTNCSVAVARNGELIYIREDTSQKYSHAEELHLFIQDTMTHAGLSFSDLDAVAVSQGPGSYTGLRIGVSAAKGLCFALDLPLIGVPTLQALAQQAMDRGAMFVVPLLDARRMEVYSAVFDSKGHETRETRAQIVDDTSFLDYVRQGKTLLLGPGAAKCEAILHHPNFEFDPKAIPSAREMAPLSYKQFIEGSFEDVAYFEPFYLKDFIALKPKGERG